MHIHNFVSLLLSPETADGKSKQRWKMRKTESVNAACSPRGEWGHSVPQTFRQINLTRTLENSREARSHSSNNHTQHPAHAVCATNTQPSSTHSLCLCRLTSTQRHKQNWTLRWNKNSCDSAHVMSVSRSLVNRQPCIWWRRSHRSTVHVSVWKETAASPPPPPISVVSYYKQSHEW